MKKKLLGQFFTTHAAKVLQGLEKRIIGKDVFDPFAGAGDLLAWAESNGAKSVAGQDIDQCNESSIVSVGDSLDGTRHGGFILTNPPYLYVNRADAATKGRLRGTGHDDLYMLAMESLLDSDEGIIIVPVNFFSAENAEFIRRKFFARFDIRRANIFTDQVFDDTTCNVVAFHYTRSTIQRASTSFEAHFIPGKEAKLFEVAEKHGWTIGGEFLSDVWSTGNCAGAHRLIEGMPESASSDNIIILKAIDGSSKCDQIRLIDKRELGVDALPGKKTSRAMAHILLDGVSISQQEEVIKEFNATLRLQREKYSSMFLTNFRDFNRKRIGFDFAYCMISMILEKLVRK